MFGKTTHFAFSQWISSRVYGQTALRFFNMVQKTLFFYALALCSLEVGAQDSFTNSGLTTLSSLPDSPASTGSGYSFNTGDGQITVTSSTSHSAVSNTLLTSGSGSQNQSASATSSTGQSQRTSTSQKLTALVGTRSSSPESVTSASNNGTISSTAASSAPLPSNTTPCNGHPEFCARKYSNITQICAHNSAFAVKNNAASNQDYGITRQLNDGIRMSMYHYYPASRYCFLI
jgi:hypothetical protein